MNKIEIFLVFVIGISWLGIVLCMIGEKYMFKQIDNLFKGVEFIFDENKHLSEIIYDLRRKMTLMEQGIPPIHWKPILKEAETKYKEKLKEEG